MAEDWRLTVSLTGGFGHTLASALHELELGDETEALLGERVAVSAAADRVLLYADSRATAEEARIVVSKLLVRDGREAGFALERWHPLAEEWEDAELPLPASVEEREAERERLEAKDAAVSREAGFAEWEVRLDLPRHRDALELATRLESEGIRSTRRWRYLLVGAASRDEAEALASRLRAEVPAGGAIQVQPGGEMAWEAAPSRPFPLFLLPS